MINWFNGFYAHSRFPVAVHLDRNGDIVITGHNRDLPGRRLPSDEGCRNLVCDLVKTGISPRPILVTYREACKLYALAWLLADQVPASPIWTKVIARFTKRSSRAAHLWEHSTRGFDCAQTADLFRALVFAERSRAASPERVVLDHPDLAVIRKATRWFRHHDYMKMASLLPFRRQVMARIYATSPVQQRMKRGSLRTEVQWAGVNCPKPETLVLMPVHYQCQATPWCSVVVTNVRDLPVSGRGCANKHRTARALEDLAARIAAVDPTASAHSLIAMQGPLLIAAEQLRSKGSSQRR
jgi:hypothetical protein